MLRGMNVSLPARCYGPSAKAGSEQNSLRIAESQDNWHSELAIGRTLSSFCKLGQQQCRGVSHVLLTVPYCLSAVIGVSQTSKTCWRKQQDGSGSRIPILLLEGRVQRGEGTNPIHEFRERHAQAIQSLHGTSAESETALPAIGVEVIGNDIQ